MNVQSSHLLFGGDFKSATEQRDALRASTELTDEELRGQQARLKAEAAERRARREAERNS